MLRLVLLSVALVFLCRVDAVCYDKPFVRPVVVGRVAIIRTQFRADCTCAGRVNWLCYVSRGLPASQCAADVRCQRAGGFTQVYGLLFGTTYDFTIGGVCAGESEQVFKNALCAGGQREGVHSFQSEDKVPSASPEAVSSRPLTFRELEVCWKPPPKQDQNGRITSYNLKCSGCGQETYRVPSTSSCTVIRGLAPKSIVGVSVQAENSAGVGPYSKVVSTKMEVQTPGNPPRNLQCMSAEGRSLQLSWSHPVRDAIMGGPLHRYLVEVTDASTGSVRQVSVPYMGQDSRTYSLGGLKPVNDYRLRIAVENRFGVGPFTSVSTCSTLEDVPGAPPSLEAVPVSGSVVMVTLTPPPADSSNGVIREFTLRYCRCDGMDCAGEPTEVTTGGREVRLTGLRPRVMYCLQAAASTAQGQGPFSALESVLTSLQVPPAVTGVSVSDVTPTSAQVCWRLPDGASSSASGFRLQYGPVGSYFSEQLNSLQLQVPMVEGRMQYCHRLTGLEENARYQVRVSASNSVGQGDSVAQGFKTHSTAPSGPPVEVSAKPAQRSLALRWCSPLKKDRNGIISSYVLQLSSVGESPREEAVPKGKLVCTLFTVEGLTPGRAYQLRLRAANEVGMGPFSPVLNVRTKEDAPSAAGLRILRTEARSSLIVYSRPQQPNGVLTSYTLTLTPVSPACFQAKRQALAASASASSIYSVFGLRPGVQYRVCLQAVNSFAAGPPTCTTTTTSGAAPNCPMNTQADTLTTIATVVTIETTKPTTPSTTSPPTTNPPTTSPPTTNPPTTKPPTTNPPTTKPPTTSPPTTSPPTTRPPTTKPPTTRPPTTKPPTTNPPTTKPPTTRPPTTKPPTTRPPTTRPPTTRPPTTRPPTPAISRVCSVEHNSLTLRSVGGVGVLVGWSGKCDSRSLSYSTGPTSRQTSSLGKFTRLFFLATYQFRSKGSHDVCVTVSCSGVECTQCHEVIL